MFTTRKAAHYLALSETYLEKLRVIGGGPEFVKFGKAVRYEKEALDRWIASRRRRTTSDVSTAA
jgi:excisionase family DNA binding protein